MTDRFQIIQALTEGYHSVTGQRQVAKSHIPEHTSHSKTGKVFTVKEHEDKRNKQAKRQIGPPSDASPKSPMEFKTDSWNEAGFITPGGKMLGKVGRHREITAKMGFGTGNEKGNEAIVTQWMGVTGAVRITRFASEAAASAATMPTRDQIRLMVMAANGKRLDVDLQHPETAEMLEWKTFEDPSEAEITGFFRRAIHNYNEATP